MARLHRRNEWHQVNGKWTRSLGERGTRVRLFQKRKGSAFYREVWCAGRGKDRKCLHTYDRSEAERLGRELLAALLRQEGPTASGPLELRYLLDRYRSEAACVLDNGESSLGDIAQRAKVLVGYFGASCDVRSLTDRDILGFQKKRAEGGILREDGKKTRAVRTRSIEADVKLLNAALRWATTVRIGQNRRLLEFNPLDGVKRPRERNPKRPVATWERFQKTREAIQALRRNAEAAEAESEALTWRKLELALVLAEATGRRLGSIRQLRWEDIDFTRAEVRWRADADKKGKEWGTPIPASLLEELRTFRRELAAVGGWIFPTAGDSEEPMRSDVLGQLLLRAEREAKLPKLDGGVWHPYRRKWATERKHLSLKDVAAVGGWNDVSTLLTCYQHADRNTMLAVMNEPRKVTERGMTGS